ncbi:MAG TPA: hypothetical protein VFO05_16880 [Candidatus Limnocylindrales bacterium]|nr:hypothetical protein [Candidatus Limnocylindrales bacterium]
MTAEVAAGFSALTAAVATVVGAVTLMLFFARGQPWGTINDVSSVVLMLAMIPVALVTAVFLMERLTTVALVVAAIGIAGMVAAAVLQALLVAGRVTYDGSVTAVLTAGGVVGVWYTLTGLLAGGTALQWLAGLAIASGVGFVAIMIGFRLGRERHPLSIGGGLVVLVASTAFLTLLGNGLVSGDLVVPAWNA